MPTSLNLVLEGNAPGLPEHALSISAFGTALFRLVGALQRIGSGLVKDAAGENYGARGGRQTLAGRSIDVELVSLQWNSPLNIGMRVVERPVAGVNLNLFDDFTARTTDRFLEAVEAESKGRPYNMLVRRFLAAIPPEVTSQSYFADTGKRVTVRTVELPEILPPLPYLVELTGAVVGLAFEPGKPEVKIKTADGTTFTCSATNAQVEEALVYRGAAVRLFALRGHKNRVLAIGPVDKPFSAPSADAREEYLFAMWGDLLKRLAE